MKLKRLNIGGFGPLHGEFTFDPGKLTLLVDDNERGKSTLLSAITAALYGLENDRRTHRVMTPLERWRPWEGGAFKIELELESNGERLTVKRDFERATVEVWNGSGKDVTEQYRAGKDDYPVGKFLLGLDSSEFEKCALVRQGDLDQVVPGDERIRRQSTLHARLENAADTRGGDTNATEALQVLSGAAAQYTCEELGSTLKVETAIQRLELQKGVLETDLNTLEHSQEKIAAPLAELGAIAEEEKAVREKLANLDSARRGAMAADIRKKLGENDQRKAELQALKGESQQLRGAAQLPVNAEAELRETVARHEEAMRSLDTLEVRRRDQQAKERERLEAELAGLKQYADASLEDADRFVGLALEVRRIADEDERLRTEAFTMRDTLASKGHMPERINMLQARFGSLDEKQQRLIRGQSDLALVFQTEVAELEQARSEATETLREIDSQRQGKKLPGWILTAIGIVTLLAGITFMLLKTPFPLWVGLVLAGTLGIVCGVPLLAAGSNARQTDRETALKRLSDAQRRLNQLRTQRAESEVTVSEMSRAMGYRDPVEMMRDWTEFTRLMDESAPVLRAQQQMELLREQRAAAIAEIKGLIEKVGGGAPDPANLERIAQGIRMYAANRKRAAELEKGWDWIDDEKRVAEAAAAGLKERAVRILSAANIEYDAGRTWADHITQLSALTRSGVRYDLLITELIPQAERRLMTDNLEAELRGQLGGLEAQGATEATARAATELDRDTQVLRAQLDELQQQREGLRIQVEEVQRRYHHDHPAKSAELEKINAALLRAQRFQKAIELARETIQSVAVETHRRWADWLNERVVQILQSVGSRIEQVRFGEDLDFSVKFTDGQQVARGRAVGQLSAGARDQLHMAVRLAISEYLSKGSSPLPLLIDDAFATSDDTRARAGIRLLIEHFSKHHQILVVTCHRERYESLAKQDRALFAERVQWLDLKALTAKS